MACSTANAFDIVCRLDRDGKLEEAPQNWKQKVATGLLRGKLHEQDFAGPTIAAKKYSFDALQAYCFGINFKL